jgi:p-aminobenzoyl-glutamate transporter AbgT
VDNQSPWSSAGLRVLAVAAALIAVFSHGSSQAGVGDVRPVAGHVVTAGGQTAMKRVIITLAGSSGGPGAAAEIRVAQERVIALLDKSGEAYEINRRYDLVPQMALTVSVRGASLLRASPDVKSVQDDGVSGTF